MNIPDVFSQGVSCLGDESTKLTGDIGILQMLGLYMSSGVPRISFMELLVTNCAIIPSVLESQHCINHSVELGKPT